MTMWVAADFENVSGRKLLLSALKHVVSKAEFLFSFLLSHFVGYVVLLFMAYVI